MKRYEKLKNKAININSNINASKRRLKNSKDRLDELNDRVEKLRDEYKIHSESIDVLKEIIEGMSVNHIEKIENMITYGLQTIFYDRDYAAEIQVEDKRNSKHA
jgi:chromosome segregation ATPase